ncbi:Glutamyl-Q tRNA(Asp) synthetase [Dirofilaria immitis]
MVIQRDYSRNIKEGQKMRKREKKKGVCPNSSSPSSQQTLLLANIHSALHNTPTIGDDAGSTYDEGKMNWIAI